MTDLHAPVSRRTISQHNRWKKRIVATLSPGDVITLRLERSSRSFSLPIEKLYDQAEMQAAKLATQ